MKRYRLTVLLRFPPHEYDDFFDGNNVTKKVLRGSFRSLRDIERKKCLYGPEPWLAYAPPGTKGSDYVCCSGYECGCGGTTHAEASAAKRKDFRGEVIGFEVHEREITAWKPLSRESAS